MARYPLLKADEEVELARRVRFLEEFRELQASLHTNWVSTGKH
ncbi:sigma-70 factor domain-containing protein [Scytonema sp. UIC 10036]|nr:sigma-70 factor domain-containing protein [Scytonema sp. UIC 10036]